MPNPASMNGEENRAASPTAPEPSMAPNSVSESASAGGHDALEAGGLEDENAFGILVSYFGIEEDEYAAEAAAFAERYSLFCAQLFSFLETEELLPGLRAVQFGHALYLELPEESLLEQADGSPSSSEQRRAPIAWLKKLRQRLSEVGFESAGILSFGGRWVSSVACETVRRVGSVTVHQVSLPSEPLRRALYAETACHGVPTEAEAWGPGLYVDTDAISALGLSMKNTPTALSAVEATFYRMGR